MTGENLNVTWKNILKFLIICTILISGWTYMVTAISQDNDPDTAVSLAIVFSAIVLLCVIMSYAMILFRRREEKR